MSDAAFSPCKPRSHHLTAKSEPWTSAGPRLGPSIDLATRLLPDNPVLRENREAVREPRPTKDGASPYHELVSTITDERELIPTVCTIMVAGAPIADYQSIRLKFRLLIVLSLLIFGGVVERARGGVVESAHHSDGLLDLASSLVVPEVPDKYPLELRSTSSVDIVVGHARKDQSGGILVSGLARRRMGSCRLGPNMKLDVVVRGPHREVVEQTTTDCYLRSPGHGLAAQAHFALYLKSVPPPGSSVEISCRPG